MARPLNINVKRTIYGVWWWTSKDGHIKHRAFKEPKGAPSDHWEKWTQWIRDHRKPLSEGDFTNMRTITIELRFDADEDGQNDVLIESAKSAAKHLFTNALLMSNKRKPQIALYTSDMFAGQEEISMAADLES